MKVAIVHYWLVTMRGGEKALQALLELFPEADIYTHVYNPAAMPESINKHTVYTSYINKLPFAKKMYQKYMPLMPNALLSFNLQDYDLIISSESGPAKGVVPNPDAYHLCYCHSPMRYLWDMYHDYFREAGFLSKFFMKRLVPSLRIWDITSANMVDRFATNSNFVAKRIMRTYNRNADVIYGPVNVEKYFALERKPSDFYLFFGQLTDYKRADIAMKACIASGRKIVVAGSGKLKKTERHFYEKSGLVSFKGRVSDEEALELYASARALIFPGIEDLGLVPIEANAAGCPVIAFGKGGVLDTIQEGVTGLFFNEQTESSLIKALDQFESMENQFRDRAVFTAHVKQFSSDAFKEKILRLVAERKRI